MFFDIHTSYYGAKMTYINIVKIHLVLHGIYQLILVPEMKVIDGYFIKIERPWFAWSFFSGIAGTKIIDNKFEVGSTVFLFFEIKGTVIQLNGFKIDGTALEAIKKRKAFDINSQFWGIQQGIPFFIKHI